MKRTQYEMVKKLAKELRNYIVDNFTDLEIIDNLDLFNLMIKCDAIQSTKFEDNDVIKEFDQFIINSKEW